MSNVLRRICAVGASAAIVAGALVTVSASSASATTSVSSCGSLATALAAGGTITVTANLTGCAEQVVNAATTLDLNGKHVTLQGSIGNAGLSIQTSVTLTVEDLAGGGVLSATGGGSNPSLPSNVLDRDYGHAGILMVSAAGLTIESGSVVATGGDATVSDGGGGDGVAASHAVVTLDGGHLSVAGGGVVAGSSRGAGTGLNVGIACSDGCFVMNGGTFDAQAGPDASVAAISLASSLTFTGQPLTDADGTTLAEYNGESLIYTVNDGAKSFQAQSTDAANLSVTMGYLLSFDTGAGSSIDPVFVPDVDGAAGVMPADPTLGGSTFGGWYTDANDTTPFDPAQSLTGDTTIYAKWTDGSSGGSDDGGSGDGGSGDNGSSGSGAGGSVGCGPGVALPTSGVALTITAGGQAASGGSAVAVAPAATIPVQVAETSGGAGVAGATVTLTGTGTKPHTWTAKTDAQGWATFAVANAYSADTFAATGKAFTSPTLGAVAAPAASSSLTVDTTSVGHQAFGTIPDLCTPVLTDSSTAFAGTAYTGVALNVTGTVLHPAVGSQFGTSLDDTSDWVGYGGLAVQLVQTRTFTESGKPDRVATTVLARGIVEGNGIYTLTYTPRAKLGNPPAGYAEASDTVAVVVPASRYTGPQVVTAPVAYGVTVSTTATGTVSKVSGTAAAALTTVKGVASLGTAGNGFGAAGLTVEVVKHGTTTLIAKALSTTGGAYVVTIPAAKAKAGSYDVIVAKTSAYGQASLGTFSLS